MNGSVNGKWPLRLSVRTKDSQSLKRGPIPLGANKSVFFEQGTLVCALTKAFFFGIIKEYG